MTEIDLYIHGDKESAYDAGKGVDLSEKALDEFMYAGYEHKVTYLVDRETGHFKPIAFDGFMISTEKHVPTIYVPYPEGIA